MIQGKLMIQPGENGKNPNFGPNLGSLKFSSCVLSLLLARKCSKLPSYAIYWKTNKTTWKNDKKPNFRPDFGPFWPKFGPKKFFCGFCFS